MNTQSNAIPESSAEARPMAAAMRPFYWCVRRELWEHRSIYVAPLAGAGVFLFGFLISMITLPHRMQEAMALDAMKRQAAIEQPYDFAALLLMGVTLIVAIFYCLDALHGERRDRSILFWKSLPVSDVTAVVSKAAIPLVVLPLVTFAVTVVTQWIMLMLSTVALMGSGTSVATLWTNLHLWHMLSGLFFHLLAIHGFWYAPFFGWLVMVSAWARRMPFLWAVLPPMAIGVVEKLAFNTSYFAMMLGSRFAGDTGNAAPRAGDMSMDAMTPFTPLQFVVNPRLWIGLAITAAFLAAAVQLLRYREPI
jgi:ABC-2 type transport system permease protein